MLSLFLGFAGAILGAILGPIISNRINKKERKQKVKEELTAQIHIIYQLFKNEVSNRNSFSYYHSLLNHIWKQIRIEKNPDVLNKLIQDKDSLNIFIDKISEKNSETFIELVQVEAQLQRLLVQVLNVYNLKKYEKIRPTIIEILNSASNPSFFLVDDYEKYTHLELTEIGKTLNKKIREKAISFNLGCEHNKKQVLEALS